jgi:hypothetical protein
LVVGPPGSSGSSRETALPAPDRRRRRGRRRLDTHPKEQVVKAEGYDDASGLVAADEVILNQPRGELRVRILEPARGRPVVAGKVPVKAEVVVPEEARVEKVEVLLNEELLATLSKPPWETEIEGLEPRTLAPLAAHRSLVEALGGWAPKDCLTLPVTLRSRLVCYLYGDNRDASVSGVPLVELKKLARKAGVAFEVSILKNKIRTL